MLTRTVDRFRAAIGAVGVRGSPVARGVETSLDSERRHGVLSTSVNMRTHTHTKGLG